MSTYNFISSISLRGWPHADGGFFFILNQIIQSRFLVHHDKPCKTGTVRSTTQKLSTTKVSGTRIRGMVGAGCTTRMALCMRAGLNLTCKHFLFVPSFVRMFVC